MPDLSRGEAGFERGKMMMRDVLVGDYRGRRARREPRHMRARFADETGADQDVVAALSEIDPEPFHRRPFRR